MKPGFVSPVMSSPSALRYARTQPTRPPAQINCAHQRPLPPPTVPNVNPAVGDVIVGLNGRRVRSAFDLSSILDECAAGSMVAVRIVRNAGGPVSGTMSGVAWPRLWGFAVCLACSRSARRRRQGVGSVCLCAPGASAWGVGGMQGHACRWWLLLLPAVLVRASGRRRAEGTWLPNQAAGDMCGLLACLNAGGGGADGRRQARRLELAVKLVTGTPPAGRSAVAKSRCLRATSVECWHAQILQNVAPH